MKYFISILTILLVLMISGRLYAAERDTEKVKELLKSSRALMDYNPDSALLLTGKANELALILNNDSLILKSLILYADIYILNGNYYLAVDYCFRANSIMEKTLVEMMSPRQRYALFYVNSNIALCYFELKVYDLAEEYYQESLEIFKLSEKLDPGTIPAKFKTQIKFNLGSIYLEKKKWDKAGHYIKQFEMESKKQNDSSYYVALMINKGVYYKETGKPALALDSYMNAYNFALKSNNKSQLARVHNNLGIYYKNLENTSEALKHFHNAKEIGLEVKAWRTVKIAAKELSKLYAEAGDYQKAYENNELISYLNDSIPGPDKAENSSCLALQYKFDKNQRISQIEQRHMIEKQRNQKTISYLISTVFLLLLLVAFYLVRGSRSREKLIKLENEYLTLQSLQIKQEKEEMKKDFDTQGRIMTERAMYQIQKNEFVASVARELKDLSDVLPDSCSYKIEKISKKLLNEKDSAFWKEFQLRFIDINSEFYKALKLRFPDLTPSEKKLAAFLRLNLSTKDIASIVYQNPESIKVARSRLRKKLGLSKDENLVSFLEGIGNI
ncbi:MAG: hypothetical protein K0B15_12195 [Lentimicrobium sp.]|nr:hypothetical protein [Lentimicrobium sp.]